MNIVSEKIEDILIITLEGKYIDAGNSKEVKNKILKLIEDNSRVILSMGELEFIDSSGIGVIISLLRTLSAKEGDLKLCSVSPKVRLILELVKIHKIIEIFNNKEEAINGFKQK